MNRFILIGPPDPESDDNLYWSNETGWGSFEGATIFPYEIVHATLPLETQAIAELDDDNKVGPILEIVKTMPPPWGGVTL